MAETVVKTVENVDRLFSQIVVNGEVHESENYVAPTPSQSTPQTQPATVTPEPASQPVPTEEVQGEDVYAVELNNVIHNFIDRIVTQGLADETQARRSADAVIQGAINAITALIPSTASSSNKLVTSSDVNVVQTNLSDIQALIPSQATSQNQLATSSDVNVVQASISDIQALIPSQATSQNQLADKNFVNSSIATNTANFLGTYTSLADIQAIQNPTNNDYAYLQTVDSAGNTQFQRYKYSSADSQWHYEYTLNNSSFTAEQWATINSGLTASSVSQQISSAVADKLNSKIDTVIEGSAVDRLSTSDIQIVKVVNYNIGWVSNDGFIIDIPWSEQFGFQIALDDQSNWIAIRSKQSGVWNPWERIYAGYKLNALTFTYTLNSGYSADFIGIETMNYQCGGINVFQLSISNIAGTGIGTAYTTPIGTCNLRPKEAGIAIGFDYITGLSVRLAILTDGQIVVNESTGITSGNNQIKAVFTMLL